MSFMKDVTVYRRGKIHVYINQCHANGRKTKIFAVRKDSAKGRGDRIGWIEFTGGWRQYVFVPDFRTQWSATCLQNIANFIALENAKRRKAQRKIAFIGKSPGRRK